MLTLAPRRFILSYQIDRGVLSPRFVVRDRDGEVLHVQWGGCVSVSTAGRGGAHARGGGGWGQDAKGGFAESKIILWDEGRGFVFLFW